MQKKTKELFSRLKELRPIIHSISYYYGIDWKSDKLVERYYLEWPNQHFSFNTEKELQDELIRLTNSTESDLGFRYPYTTVKLKLENESDKP